MSWPHVLLIVGSLAAVIAAGMLLYLSWTEDHLPRLSAKQEFRVRELIREEMAAERERGADRSLAAFRKFCPTPDEDPATGWPPLPAGCSWSQNLSTGGLTLEITPAGEDRLRLDDLGRISATGRMALTLRFSPDCRSRAPEAQAETDLIAALRRLGDVLERRRLKSRPEGSNG